MYDPASWKRINSINPDDYGQMGMLWCDSSTIWDYNNQAGIEERLEVQLPTVWTDEKQRWEESEKRREEKKKKKKVREEKESEERRCRCAKRYEGRETFCVWLRRVEKKACWSSGCGAIWPHERWNCTPLRHEARVETKMHQTIQPRTIFGISDVEKEHAVVVRSTRQGFCTLFCWSLPHSITLDYTTATITSIITATASPYANCITPQRFNTLLYIPLRHTSVNYITHEHCIAVFTVHYTTWNTYTSLQSATLRYITAIATTTLLYRTLRYLALQHTALITVQHLRVKLHYATTTTTALLHHTTSSTCGWADRQVTIEMIEKHISNHLATENWFAICESQRPGSPVGIY